MNAILADNLLTGWLAMTGLSVAVIVAVVLWAIRGGQFRNQEHARHLPLEIDAPDGASGPDRSSGERPGIAHDEKTERKEDANA